MRTKLLYVFLAIASLGAYLSVRDFLARPEPTMITISNLTVNLLIGLGLLGAGSPWLTRKLFPKAPKWTLIGTAIVLGVLAVLLLKLFGMPTRI